MHKRIENGTPVIATGPYGNQYRGTVIGWDDRTGCYKIRHEGATVADLWEPHAVQKITLALEPEPKQPQREDHVINLCPRDPWARNFNN